MNTPSAKAGSFGLRLKTR